MPRPTMRHNTGLIPRIWARNSLRLLVKLLVRVAVMMTAYREALL